ncbi:MAG TPA: glycosyltransferase, partial [Acidimicrobiales bacterium]|nr:glycosyltransferase [Acidimicrobiales bacterium]
MTALPPSPPTGWALYGGESFLRPGEIPSPSGGAERPACVHSPRSPPAPPASGRHDKFPALTRLSLNVVVYNEEARLEDCLRDARPHVDEIVVVDQMSTDATPEIAERLADVHVRDIHHGHAEPSRELAASRSSGDWILVLDADEKLSDRLKAELPDLLSRGPDGYWINKANYVDGVPTGTVLHFRLFRKSRATFDPAPHGGARAVSDNVGTYEEIGIVHHKSAAEQLFDDSRYDQIAREEHASTASKRNWLQHNHTLRQQRAGRRRTDLERLIPKSVETVLVAGDVRVEPPGCSLIWTDLPMPDGAAPGEEVDAAVAALDGGPRMAATLAALSALVRPGGTVIGTVPAARNRRRLEQHVGSVLGSVLGSVVGEGPPAGDGPPAGEGPAAGEGPPAAAVPAGATRAGLQADLADAGLEVCWVELVRDRWLNPVPLRPDGTGTVVESDEFLLKRVPAEVAEELTAEEIVFAAVRRPATEGAAGAQDRRPRCSVVLARRRPADAPAIRSAFGAALGPDDELVVVPPGAADEPTPSLAAQWNTGARMATGQLVAFLSDDDLPAPGWLDRLVEAFRSRDDAGAVGSLVVGNDGMVEHAGLAIGPDGVPYRLYQGDVAHAFHVRRPRIMPAVAAGGMVTDRARFVSLGGFDEDLGEDLTDTDLCLRLRARGLPILYTPAAVLRSSPRATGESRRAFRRAAREFAGRWSGAAWRSDEIVCAGDGWDANRQWGRSWRLPRPAASAGPGTTDRLAVAWTSHFFEHGGYTEEAVAAVEALDDAGVVVVANAMAWDRRGTPLPAAKAKRLDSLFDR